MTPRWLIALLCAAAVLNAHVISPEDNFTLDASQNDSRNLSDSALLSNVLQLNRTTASISNGDEYVQIKVATIAAVCFIFVVFMLIAP